MKKIFLISLCILMSLVSGHAANEFRLILGADAVTVIPDDNVKKWFLCAVTEKNSQQLWSSSVNRANMQALGFTSPTPECIYTWKVWANASKNGGLGFVNAKFGQLTLKYENIAILNDKDYKGEPFTFVIAYVQKTSENFGYEIISDLTMQDLVYDPGFTFHPNFYSNSEDSTFFFNPNDANVEYWYTVINEKNRKDSTDLQIWSRAANPTTFLGIGDITPLKGYSEYISLAGYKGGDHSVIFAGIAKNKVNGKRVPEGEVHRFTFTPDADRQKEDPKDTTIVVPETNVKDTLEFATTDVMPELSDNEGKYIYSIYSLDGKWKVQINYNAASRYGHITEKEFNLSGEGANYNYLRNAKNDMELYLFKKLEANVTAGADGETLIEINGLITPDYYHKDIYRRVLIHATLPAYTPKDTINIDMGHAYVSYNEYNSYYSIEAYNPEYTLFSGFFGTSLDDAAYMTRDLIKPYLIHKGLSNDTLSLCAPCEHILRVSHEGDIHYFAYDIISEDLHLYHITFDDKVEIVEPTDTVNIQCYNTQATDASELYGVYVYFGENNTYQVSIAVKKSAIENNNTVYSNSDIDLEYSLIYNTLTGDKTQLNSATATLVDNGDQTYDLRANLIGRDQILYKVAMPIGYSVLPEVVDTTDINMELGRIDYATGVAGAVGIVGYTNDAEIHIYFYNAGTLEGHFAEDRFFYDGASYLTRQTETSYRFTNITWANADMTKVGDNTKMTFLCYTITNEMFRININMPKLECLTQETYSVDLNDDVFMVALRDTVFPSGDAIFTVQFQYAEDYQGDEPVGDQYYFTYQFLTNNNLSLAGKFAYNDETLNMDRWHTIIENNVELYVGPMAGTLDIVAGDEVTLNYAGKLYKSHYYTITSSFVGENGVVYEVSGKNFVIAIDSDGNLLALKEDKIETGLDITDAEGNIVKKQVINGQLYIEHNGRRYSVLGQ